MERATRVERKEVTMIFTTKIASPVGNLVAASDGENLVGLWVEGQKYFMATVNENQKEQNDLPVFKQARTWLNTYFKGEDPGLIPPIELAGTDFRKHVWDLLLDIPYGELTTYGEIAQKLAASRGVEKMSARAVGGAVGHNPLLIMVPCHRVVGADGNLTGFGGGMQCKIELLKLEKVDFTSLKIPTKGTAL